MPVIDLPKIGPIQFDDSLTGDELGQQMQSLADKYGFEIPGPQLSATQKVTRGWNRGIQELENLGTNIIPSMTASAFGYDDYAKQKLQEASERQQAIQNGAYAPEYASLSNVHSPSQFGGWSLEQLGEQIPTLLTAMLPGIGAEAIAGRVALGTATKDLIAQAAEKGLEGEAKNAFVEQGLNQAGKQIASNATNVGHAATYLGMYAQSAPQTFQDIYDKTGELAPSAAAIFGAGQAALNTVLPATLSKSLSGPAQTSIIANLLTKSGMEPGLVQHIAAGILQDAGIQATAAGGNEALNIAAEKFVGNNPQVFDSDDWHRVMNSAVSGAVLGAPFGAITGLGGRINAKRANEVEMPQTTEQSSVVNPVDLKQSQDNLKSQLSDAPDMNAHVDAFNEAIKNNKVGDNTPIETPLTSQKNPITEDDFTNMGIGKTNKSLRNDILGKDLNDPEQATYVKNSLSDYANNPNLSSQLGARVAGYLDSDRFTNTTGDQDVRQNVEQTNDTASRTNTSMDAGTESGNIPGIPERSNPAGTIPVTADVGIPNDREIQQPNTLNEPINSVESAQPDLVIPEQQATLNTQKANDDTLSPEQGVVNKLYGDPNLNNNKVVNAAKSFADSGRITPDDLDYVKNITQSNSYTPIESAQELQKILDGSYKLFSPATKGNELSDTGKNLYANNDARGLINHLSSTIDNPDIKRVLQKFNGLKLKPQLETGPVEGNRAGYYDPRTNTIRVDPNLGLNEHTVIHEMTHAAISKVLDQPNHPLTKDFTGFYNQIKKFVGDTYGGQNLQEFAAELTSNPEFQSLLKSIKAPKSENLFQRIMRSVAEFFGFNKSQSAYERGLDYVNKAIDISNDVAPHPADKMYMGTGDAFGAVGNIGKAMSPLAGKTIEQTKNTLSNMPDKIRLAAMGTLRLDHMNTLYKKDLPAIQGILDSIEGRAGYIQQRGQELQNNLKNIEKVEGKNKASMEKMANIAIDASMSKVDILDPKFVPKDENKADYDRLKKEFNSLPKDVQDVYNNIRSDYDNKYNEHLNVLLGNEEKGIPGLVEPSTAKKLRAEYEANKSPGYVPFKRYGDYKIEYADPKTGERTVSAFESRRERQQFIDNNLKNVDVKQYEDLSKEAYRRDAVPSTSFLGKIMHNLEDQGVGKDTLDDIYQSYLELFPSNSISKQFMHRQGIAGMSKDMVRTYANTMNQWNNKLSRSIFNTKLDKSLSELRVQGEQTNNDSVRTAAKNVLMQSDFFHNPTFGTLTRAGAQISYFESIAGNISSAAMNLMYIPTMIMPILGARHGAGPMLEEIGKSIKLAMNKDWGNIPRYRELYKTLADHDQITHTAASDVIMRGNGNINDLTSLRTKIANAISIPFSASEKYNRVATVIAAFELAQRGDIGGRKMTAEEAIRYALDTTKEINTSALGATSARWMHSGMGRTFLTFKNYTWNSAFVIGRAFHQAFKGEDPIVRKMAQRQLIGIFGMAASMGGLRALPFYGAASTLGTIINALFGDSDEPFDFGAQMREHFGDLLYKGPVNYLTNIELASRVGHADNLIFQDDPKGVEQNGYAMTALKDAFGPTGNVAMNMHTSFKEFQNGNIERSIETLMPAMVRNVMKGTRFLTEGATTAKGDPIESDINAWNSMMQGIGFAPSDLSSTYETRAAEANFEREVLQEKKMISTKYEMAQRTGDSDLMQSAQQDMTAFNSKFPAIRINQVSLENAIRNNLKQQKDMMYGIKFNHKLLPTIKEEFGEQ